MGGAPPPRPEGLVDRRGNARLALPRGGPRRAAPRQPGAPPALSAARGRRGVTRMRVLVTGGAGFIGSNLIRLILAERDWDVVNLDLLTYAGNPENLADVERDPRYRFVHGDICDPAVARESLAGV